MMPVNLTPDQKEQLKMARRANMRIEETWSLYTMFLSQDKRPHDALESAVEAVHVWAEWMDDNQVEPPEIEQPTFSDQMKDVARMMAESFSINKLPSGFGVLKLTPDGGLVDAEFVPDAPAGVDSASQETSSTVQPKEEKP